MMNTSSETVDSIREVNLLYLRLAQILLNEDRASAISLLGVPEPLAGAIGNLSSAQIARLADCAQVLCRFRFDDHVILSTLGSHDKLPANACSSDPAHVAAQLAS